MRNFILTTIIIAISSFLGVLLIEALYRLYIGEPVFAWKDFRQTVVVSTEKSSISAFDPVLGWTLKPNYSSGEWSQMEHGIRQNHPDARFDRSSILAVGDSFTYGSEVPGPASWPAYLENLIETPVMNGGVGGYGTDQIILRAEQLLKFMDPPLLIVSFLQDDILRARYTHFGESKPYFTVDEATLVFHPPEERGSSPPRRVYQYNSILNLLRFSAIGHGLMVRALGSQWLGSQSQTFRQVDVDEVEVTCLLLERLKATTDRRGIRLILFMQYGGAFVSQFEEPEGYAQLVMNCAGENGIQVVDYFPALKEELARGIDHFRSLFMMHGDQFGHMSPVGNKSAAEVLAKAINSPPDLAIKWTAESVEPEQEMPFFSELETGFQSNEIIEVTQSGDSKRLEAVGGTTEHYASHASLPTPAGMSRFSFQVKPDRTDAFRVQLFDSEGNGLIYDFNTSSQSGVVHRINRLQRPQATVTPREDGWFDVRIRGKFPAENRVLIVQLREKGGQTLFESDGQSGYFRNFVLN